MIRCIIRSSVACLLLVIAAMLGSGYSSAHAQAPMSGRHLVFSTYLGGSKACFPGGYPLTFAQNAACDAQGNTYVTGATQVSDLPVLNAYQSGPAAGSTMSAFVAKYNPVGQPLWCTYLGGNNQSMGIGVAVMPDGGVVVAGLTSSAAPVPFPTTANAYQQQNNGQSDYFVTVFDANGNLRYSTYLGGSGEEGTPGYTDDNSSGNNVAVDAAGLVYVTGITNSSGSGGTVGTIKFPVTPNALQSALAGGTDAFLSIIDPAQSGPNSLVYSSFLGGNGDDKGHSVAVDALGRYITVAGYTKSTNFPTTANAYRSNAPPAFISNGFVAQVESSQPGSPSSQYTMRYCTYLGGYNNNPRDDTYGMTLDPKGLIVATGRTQSADFPMTNGGPSIFNSAPYLQPGTSGDEPYLVKIDPSLTGAASLVYSTFLGGGSELTGQWSSFCTSVGVDARGTAYVAGETCAPGEEYVPPGHPVEAPQGFPYTQNALLPALRGNWDATFMAINPGGATLGYATYLGGTGNDRTYGLAIDPPGNVVLSGLTYSDNFPLKNPAQTWPGNTGFQNAFVTKFSRNAPWTGALLLLLLDD